MSKKIYGVPVATPISPSKIGKNLVYTGSGEMPEGYTFQIDPEGEDPLSGYVKTVNGIAPDENGNVVIEGGSGGSSPDIDEIVDAVIAALPNWEGGSY